MGRKKVDEPRTQSIQVRFTESEIEKLLKYIRNKTDYSTVSPFIRDAVLKSIASREKDKV